MVPLTLCVTAKAVAVNDPEFAPGAMTRVAGWEMASVFLDRAMVAPPAGAGADNVTVQAVEAPPVIAEGEQTRDTFPDG
jgi:hypothetical protein